MFLKNLLHSKERFLILLCLVIGLLVLVPILSRFIAAQIFLDFFLTAIILKMVYAVSDNKRHIIAGLLLGAVMLASFWSQYIYPNKSIEALGMIVGVFFTSGIILNLLAFVHKSAEVNRETIYAAILLYLLAGLMWAFLYTFLELVDPASFNIELSQSGSHLLIFQYYSFVTITTLGYGDITPVSEVAKAFSILEAVVGQLYLVVAVAWLVGMYVSRKSR